MQLPDPFVKGISSGWRVIDGRQLEEDQTLEADVCIVGTGAGGGVTAEILAKSGLKVVILESGQLWTSSDFRLREDEAYRRLYQEGFTRTTVDGNISILQGRCVGGGTTVNWTSSFRTPRQTLEFWQSRFAIRGHDFESLQPWFAKMEERLSILPWEGPNANNDLLRSGCAKLGIAWEGIRRNVKGCWNLGYCGVGCPTNAKQSMLVTTLPSALAHGATLVHSAHVERLNLGSDRVNELIAFAQRADGRADRKRLLRVRARHFVLAAGGIGTPGILLRSQVPDPYKRIGRRTYLHTTIFSFAQFSQKTDPYWGAPQSIHTDHFQWKDGVTGPMGFKLEATPMLPTFAAVLLPGFGKEHRAYMDNLSHGQCVLALLRDGFDERSPEGKVQLAEDGRAVLEYVTNDYLWDGVRRAFLAAAEIQFAAGAKAVLPAHHSADTYGSWHEAKRQIEKLPYEDHRMRLGSAHVMGGCAFGEDQKLTVVDSQGRYHHLENLSVHDGSLFPTSVGANPQLSIYALVAKLSEQLADDLSS